MSTVSPKVSVIIPVYNVAGYLRQCLDSVVNQTLREIEIICLNDGSTDDSMQILTEYAARDKRIVVLSQENSGIGAARNRALTFVDAPYVYFVDSDDWLDLTCLEKLYSKMQDTSADICLLGVTTFDEPTQKITAKKSCSMLCYQNRPADICRYSDIKSVIFSHLAVYFKIFRTSFLRQNNILFPEKVTFEDVFFHVQCILLAKKITFYDENLYFYRIGRPNSEMDKGKLTDCVMHALSFLQIIYEFLHKQNSYEELKHEYTLFALDQLHYHYERTIDYKTEFMRRARQFVNECDLEELSKCGASEVLTDFYKTLKN